MGRWKDKSDFKTYSNSIYLTFVELLKALCSALHQYGMHPLRNWQNYSWGQKSFNYLFRFVNSAFKLVQMKDVGPMQIASFYLQININVVALASRLSKIIY